MISTVAEDINIIFLDMEPKVQEQVVKNPDDTYTIILNSRHSRATVMKALDHALEHIRNEDFAKHDVQKIEAMAHGMPRPDPEDEERVRLWRERADACRKWAEKEYRRIRRQLKKYEKKYDRMTIGERIAWSNMILDEYEKHKTDPEWSG